uniref:TctD-like protein n=1 Tax=Antithamnionella ternifolia TaxID=207919 RepID=A0A4D6WJY8_9FLOR|nr:hypothetical protein [Antithamnionella ternifolia]
MNTILLVDDDKFLRTSIAAFLKLEHFSIISVNSVYEALVFLKLNKPDLVITDIMMMELDGYDFLKILKTSQSLCHIPTILLTAKGLTDDRIKGYNIGCNAYLTKPFDAHELLSIINNMLKINLNSMISSDLMIDQQKIISKSIISLVKSFTHREKTILRLVLRGCTNREIANYLQLSVRNIEKYVSRLLDKTNTRNRTELVTLILSIKLKSSDYFRANDGNRTRE